MAVAAESFTTGTSKHGVAAAAFAVVTLVMVTRMAATRGALECKQGRGLHGYLRKSKWRKSALIYMQWGDVLAVGVDNRVCHRQAARAA